MDNPLLQKRLLIEQEISELELTMSAQAQLLALCEMPAWRAMQEKVGNLERTGVSTLRTQRLDPYELGLQQGFLKGLKLLSSLKPLDTQELDTLQSSITSLQEELRLLKGRYSE